jgi:hypothetical protein
MLMIIDVIIVVVGLLLTSTSPPLGVSLPLLLYLRGSEVTRKVIESVST